MPGIYPFHLLVPPVVQLVFFHCLILQRKVALICSKSGIEAYKIPEKLLILNVKHALQDDSCIAFGGSHTRFRTFVLDIAL